MADEVDRANEYAERMRDAALNRPRPEMPKGAPGECDWCGEESPRIVRGYCARCRDGLGIE